ncbi:MAG: long-chain-fatty-acid--CoA ligase [Acidimicrobiia bacterium]
MARTLAGVTREHGRTYAGRPAITFEGATLTYDELDARSNRVARALRASGVERGDRVALLDKNVPELLELVLGATRIGAVTVPVNWRLAPPEIRQIVNDARAKVLVVGAELDEAVHRIAGELVTVDHFLDTAPGGSRLSFAEWRDAQGDDDLTVPVDPHDVAIQFYTSGTTGLPKGAMLTHANLFALLDAANARLQLSDESVCLVSMPLFHVAGAGWALYGLANGSHNVMLRDVDLEVILDVIERHRITHTVFVPALLQFLLMTPGVHDADFSSLEAIIYGASPISERVLSDAVRVFGCDFYQMYGLTETNGGVVVLPPADHALGGPNAHRLRSAGVPLPGVALRIVAPDGTECPTGEVGEVWIHSPSTMLGYWNMPEATAQAITTDGWFRSGDAGSVDADGYLYIHDRVNDMIITGGENVYPAEVESALMSHPAVADAAVIGVPDERWGETVKAVVVTVPEDDAPVTDDELIAFTRERLAHYKCPTSVDRVDALPRNATGKVLRRVLREPYWTQHSRRVH